MDIEKAREMVADSRKKKCGHDSFYTCAHCEARIRAEVWLEGLDAERMFPVLILAVEALSCDRVVMSPCRKVRPEVETWCAACKALAAWEKL